MKNYKADINKLESETKSFFVRVGHGILQLCSSIKDKFDSLKAFIFKQDVKNNNETWLDMYMWPMLKIFGLLSCLVIIIILMKFVFSKFTGKLIYFIIFII